MPTRILHLDCSSPLAQVMLAVDGQVQSQRFGKTERDHAGSLPFLVDEVLAESGCSLETVDAISVCSGPGSYTGLRIALAAAKGYCYAWDKPLIMHNRLTLMLAELDETVGADVPNRLAILPARAGEFFVAASGEWTNAPAHIMKAELEEKLEQYHKPLALIGNAEPWVLQNSLVMSVIDHNFLNDAVWAKRGYSSYCTHDYADIAYATPEYLKAAYVTSSKNEK